MAEKPTLPNLSNPMMIWADLSLQALDMSWSTMQNMSDGVDRMTRAVANAEPGEGETFSSAVNRASASMSSPGFGLAAQMQRTAFELMMQNWLQWMSTLGAVASLAAGRGLGHSAANHQFPLEFLREGLQPPHVIDVPARQRTSKEH